MKNSSVDYMHRLLAESLHRGYSGGPPSHQEATILAARSVQWFRELLLRLAVQGCIDKVDPIEQAMADLAEPCGPDEFAEFSALAAIREADQRVELDSACWQRTEQLRAIHSRDELLWDALCDGRLVLRIEGCEVNASVISNLPPHVVH